LIGKLALGTVLSKVSLKEIQKMGNGRPVFQLASLSYPFALRISKTNTW